MECIVNIKENCTEEVHIFARKRTKLVDEIESLVKNGINELTGYDGDEAYLLSYGDIYFFTVENNKIYALTEKNKYHIRMRLYQIEEMLDGNFIKINQSCIANIRHILKFSASVSGALNVTFRNGYVDYVSRRNVKAVKERLGVK